MKNLTLGILPLALLGSVLFAGCASQHAESVYTELPVTTETTRSIVVLREPPPLQVEIESPAPGPIEVWVQGDWNRTNGKWIWLPGHWESRPHAGAVWVSGHWDKAVESNEWIWTPGHWA